MDNNCFWEVQRRIFRARDAVHHLMAPFCVAHGITPVQLRVLLALYHGGEQPAGALARLGGMAAANLSAATKHLAALGLIGRSRPGGDERRVLIRLTPKGHALVRRFSAQQDGTVRSLQCEQLCRQLDGFCEALERDAAHMTEVDRGDAG